MVVVKINGIEYQIEYGQNAICEIEDILNSDIIDVIKEMTKPNCKFKIHRAVFYGGLLAYKRSITLEQAGDILDGAANYKDVLLQLFTELAVSLNSKLQPEVETASENDKSQDKKK